MLVGRLFILVVLALMVIGYAATAIAALFPFLLIAGLLYFAWRMLRLARAKHKAKEHV